MVAPCQAQNGRLFPNRRRRTIPTQTNWQKVGTEGDGGAFKWTVGQKKERLSRSSWTYWYEQKEGIYRSIIARQEDGNNEAKFNKAWSRRGNFIQEANEEQWESVDKDDEEPLPGS